MSIRTYIKTFGFKVINPPPTHPTPSLIPDFKPVIQKSSGLHETFKKMFNLHWVISHTLSKQQKWRAEKVIRENLS